MAQQTGKAGIHLWQRFVTAVLRSSTDRLERMPRAKALRLGTRLGALGFRLVGRYRHYALRNLQLAYGDAMTEAERLALVRRVFEHFGRTTMDFLKAPSYDPEAMLGLVTEIEGWDEYGVPALQRGKGIVAITGHIGNFELFARYVAQRGIPLTIVARDPDDPVFGSYVKRLRQSGGYDVASKGASVRKLLASLNRGEVIGILPDQNSGDVFVPFFGVPAGTPAGPAFLALRTGAPILLAFCLAKPDYTYKIVVLPPIEPITTENREADIYRIMEQINAGLEQVVRAYPEQWLWLHNRWKASFEEKNLARWPAGYDIDTCRARWK